MKLSKHNAAKAIAALVVGALLAWWVLRKANLATVGRQLVGLRAGWVAAAAAAYVGAAVVRAWYLTILSSTPNLLGQTFVLLVAQAAALVLPGPAADASIAALLARYQRLRATHAVKATAALRLAEMTLRSILACAVCLAVPVVPWARWTIAAATGAIAAIGMSILISPARFVAVARAILRPLAFLASRLPRAGGLDDFADRLLTLHDPGFLRRVLPLLMLGGLARWALLALATYAIFASIAAPLPYLQAAYLGLLLGYVSTLPVRPPADLGTSDAARVALLVSLGWTASQAATATVSTRAVGTLVRLVAGAAAMLLLAVRGSGRQRAVDDS